MFYRRRFHCARVIISADREWRLRAPDSSVCKAGVCTRASYRGGNRVRETGRANGVGSAIEDGVGSGDGNRVGGGNGDVNGNWDGDGAGA